MEMTLGSSAHNALRLVARAGVQLNERGAFHNIASVYRSAAGPDPVGRPGLCPVPKWRCVAACHREVTVARRGDGAVDRLSLELNVGVT